MIMDRTVMADLYFSTAGDSCGASNSSIVGAWPIALLGIGLYLELVGLFFNADQGIGTIKLIGLSWREYRFAEQDDAVIMIAYFHYRIHIPLSCQYMTACIRIYYVIVIATGLYGIITDFTDFQRIHFSLDALKGASSISVPFNGQAYRQ